MADAFSSLRVRDICQRDVVAVSKDDTVSFALSLIVENRTSALPVINSAEKCLGMISASDIIGLVHELDEETTEPADPAPQWLFSKLKDHDLGRRKVEELMSSSVAAVRLADTLYDAAGVILRNKIHRLPVLDEKDRVAGIVSTTDLLEALVENRPAAVAEKA